MSTLAYKTRGQSSPQGKPRVFFCCHPEDFQPFFQEIADNVLKMQNCAIWYFTDQQAMPDDEQMETDLGQMQLFVVPVTSKLLHLSNFAADAAIPFALKQHIPVLPLMQESGLDELFCHKFGDIQFLDKRKQDPTTISYEEKLEKYLSSVLVGDELAAKVRTAFGAYIFMSYRKKDRKYAQILMRKIHANEFCRDIAIWYDEFLTPGENFNQAIADALQKSQLFTLVITPNLINETNYVMTTEYPAAMASGKTILPAELVKTDRGILERCYTDIPDCIDAYNKGALSESLFQAVRQLALPENGDSPEHNFLIGLAYLGGIDVEVDHKRALMLIQSAAEAGFIEAIKKLVSMYRTGEGVERNYNMAIQWHIKLVEILQRNFKTNTTKENAVLLANAYWTLGEYQYELDDLEAAKSSYKMLMRFSESIQQQFLQMKRYTAISCELIGFVLMRERKFLMADPYYMKSLHLKEELAASLGSAETKADLSISYCNVADIFQKAGKSLESFQYYERSLQLAEQLMIETDTRELLAFIYNKFGDAQWDSRLIEDAEKQYQKSRRICEQLARETETMETNRELAIQYYKLGEIWKLRDNLQAALDAYNMSLKIFEQIIKLTKTIEAKRDVSVCYEAIGDVKMIGGEYDSAIAFYYKSISTLKDIDNVSESLAAKHDIFESCKRIGFNLMKHDHVAEGRAFIDQCLKQDEVIRCIEKDDVTYQRVQLEKILADAENLEREGVYFLAKREYLSAVKGYKEILTRISSEEDWAHLAVTYFKLGMLEQENIEYLKESLQIWKTLKKMSPNNQAYLLWVMTIEKKLGADDN